MSTSERRPAPQNTDRQTSGPAVADMREPHAQEVTAAAYSQFQREIHSFTLHSARDADVAADVTQDAFLRLHAEVRAGRRPDNVRAWLYRVASNLVINRARHARVADSIRRVWTGDSVTDVSPEWLALQTERAVELHSALETLPDDARVGLLLSANGFSGREIAAAIGRSELATRTLLCRARGRLREQLSTSGGAG